MSKGDDELANLFMVVFALSVLVALAALFLLLDSLHRLVWGDVPGREPDERPVSLFGAPKSGWWVERYERWLWQLEDWTGADFTSSPGRLFKGSMLIAGAVGGAVALVPSAVVSLVDIRLALPVFLIVFPPVVLVCGLSAWILSKPSPGWWEAVHEAPMEREEEQIGTIFLGELREE